MEFMILSASACREMNSPWRHEGRGIGLLHKLQAYRLQEAGPDTVDANLALGLPADAGDYGNLAEVDARVVALSVDDEPTTRALVDKLRLRFPVGHSADARAVGEATGAFVNDDPLHLQSTGFVLDPSGAVVVSVYSSGAIGRLVPDDVVGLIRYLRQHGS